MTPSYPLQIVFSHEYDKLSGIQDGDKAVLVFVSELDQGIDALHERFKHFDTLYHVSGEEHHYPLPRSCPLLLLVFYCEKARKFFTTLRSSTQMKKRYYENHEGHVFRIALHSRLEGIL